MVTKMEKVFERGQLGEHDDILMDLKYWLSRPPDERVSCVEILRRQSYGNPPRLQRVAQFVRGFPS
jgi:hypothetical protein